MTKTQWFYVKDGKRQGPVDLEQLVRMLLTGELPQTTPVWHHGLTEWTEAERAPEIVAELPPPLPAATTPTAAAAGLPPPRLPPAATAPSPATPASFMPSARAERDWSVGKVPAAVKGWRAWLGKQTPDSPAPTSKRPSASPPPVTSEAQQPGRSAAVPVVPGVPLDEREEYFVPSVGPDEDLPPIPLVAADENFELEPAHETPRRAPPHPPAPVPPVGTAPSAVVSAAEPLAAPPLPIVTSGDTAVPAPVPEGRTPSEAAPPPNPSSAPRAPVAPRAPFAPPLTPAPPAPAVPGEFAWSTWSLADKDFPDLIQDLHERRWTGLLVLNQPGLEKLVTVHGGRLVFASSSSPDDRLGELLLRRGRISLRQYLEAGRAIREGKRLGAILVEQGALQAKDLVTVVMEHTREIICGLFQWTEGSYQLRDRTDSPEAITLKLSTPDIILDGIGRIDSWSRIVRGIGGLEARYERTPNYRPETQQMTLPSEKAALLMNLERPRDVQAISEGSKLSHFEVCRTLWAFRVMGVIRRVED